MAGTPKLCESEPPEGALDAEGLAGTPKLCESEPSEGALDAEGLAGTPKLCESGPPEGGLDAEGLETGGSQHSDLTHEPCRELKRHFKMEPDQSMGLFKSLVQQGDVKEEGMVEDLKRGANTMSLKQLTQTYREKLSHGVYKSCDSEREPESQRCSWSLYFNGCLYRQKRAPPPPASPPECLPLPAPYTRLTRRRTRLVYYQYKILNQKRWFW